MSLRTSIDRVIRKLANYPYYGPVGLHDPQQEVEVWLHGAGEPLQVTRNNVVAALRPFTLGVMIRRGDPRTLEGQPLQLRMHERGSNRLLGRIHLKLVKSLPLAEHRFCLLETGESENYSAPGSRISLYHFNIKAQTERRQRKNPHNFQMTQPGLEASFVFYICPRPVVLVSVEHQGADNIFPMDLIGPTESPWFSMALRTTSPAVRLMQQSRRMALSSIPFTLRDTVYELGKHHKLAKIEWERLPFRTVTSPLFGLKIPEAALRVREVRVEEFHEVGSHCLFITTVERETLPDHLPDGIEGLQLFHTFTCYRRFLSHYEKPLGIRVEAPRFEDQSSRDKRL